MVAGDQEHDGLAATFVADVKVAKAAQVAEGDAAFGVKTVTPDAVIDLGMCHRRRGLESSVENLDRCDQTLALEDWPLSLSEPSRRNLNYPETVSFGSSSDLK